MQRKTSLLPTRIWTFGARPPQGADLQVFEDQLRLAHKYKNQLVEIERRRRDKIRDVERQDGRVMQAEQQIETMSTQREALRVSIKGARQGTRTRAGGESIASSVRSQIAALTATMKAARNACKELRGTVREALAPNIAAVNEAANVEVKRARSQVSQQGLFWGTYLLVERSIPHGGPPPNFQRWTGEGRVGVQAQKGKALAAVLNIEAGATVKGRVFTHANLRLGRFTMRFPVLLHRPLPADAEIKWAWLRRTKIGRGWRYEFQITLESTTFIKPQPDASAGVVAVDVGWRLRGTRQSPLRGQHGKPKSVTVRDTRVGYWYDDRGGHGEILVPGEVTSMLEHADSLRSIRDGRFNEIRARLVAWLDSFPRPTVFFDLLHFMRLKQRWLAYLPQWRSLDRLLRVLDRWRGQRFTGDTDMLAELEVWGRKERHLYEWEAHERSRALGRRKDFYRCLAVDCARRYGVVVLERFDLRKMARLVAPESPEPDKPQKARHARHAVAISEFRNCLAATMQKAEVPAQCTTITCHACQHVEKFDAAALVVHTCPACGRTWDQDYNAARNLLRIYFQDGALPPASGEVPSSTVETDQPEIVQAGPSGASAQSTALENASTTT